MRSRLAALLCVMWLTTAAWPQALKEVPSYALKPGDQAPALVFDAVLQGPPPSEVNWQKLRGKVVVLDFWGTWCPPCIADLPKTNGLIAKFKDKPVQFIAVGHENVPKVEYFLKKHPINTWVALDLKVAVFKSFTAFGIPHAVVVNQNGIVAAVLHPGDLSEKFSTTFSPEEPRVILRFPAVHISTLIRPPNTSSRLARNRRPRISTIHRHDAA